MLRVFFTLLVLAAAGTASAGPGNKPQAGASAAEQQLAEWRKQEGAAYNQFLDAVVQTKKQLDAQPQAAGSAASQLETFIDTMALQLNMALRTGYLRVSDTIPTRSGSLTGPQLLKQLARVRREVSDFAVKYGDKAARLERLTSLERSYDWQQRQVSATAAYEATGRLRVALALATTRMQEATRFAKLAAETKQLGGITDATPLRLEKSTITLGAALIEAKKLGQRAQKDYKQLEKRAAEEQKRAEAAHRAALQAQAAALQARAAAKQAPAAASAPAWREVAIAAPLQTMEGEPPVEASPEAAAEAESQPAAKPAEAAPAPAEPAQPACNPHGSTCGNTNPPDNPCCPGMTCSSRTQFSDGSLGLGYCQ